MRRFNENSQFVRSFNVNRVNDVDVNTRAALPMLELRLKLRGDQLRGKPSIGGQLQPMGVGNQSALSRGIGYRGNGFSPITDGCESWQTICHETPTCHAAFTEVDTTLADDSAIAYRPQACATLFCS